MVYISLKLFSAVFSEFNSGWNEFLGIDIAD